MFTFVHGVFVFALFGPSKVAGHAFALGSLIPGAIQETKIQFAALAIVASHAVSFVTNYVHGGEYRNASLDQLMSQPYSRVVVLHMAILGGGFAMMALKSPLVGLVLLVALETPIDIKAHRAERRKFAAPGPQSVPTRFLASNS